MAGASVQWTDHDLVTLLSILNYRIEDIRPAIMQDQRKGLLYASRIISEGIGNGCTASRVERKIRQLWATYGNPEGGKDPYEVCLHEETSKASSNSDRGKQPQLRRSRRKAASHKHEGPVYCRCGFTHNILWVHCDGCASWQHAYCYYDTEDESKLPDSHLCDNCSPIDEGPLNQKLSQLHIQLEKVNEKRRGELRQLSAEGRDGSATQLLGPFGLPIDEEVMWGPDDTEIRNYLNIIRAQLLGVSNSLEPELEISKAAVSDAKSSDTSLLLHKALGVEYECWLRPEMADPASHRPQRRQILQAILAATMTAWVFPIPHVQRPSYDSILLFHYQQEVFNKHGMPLLESLHRQALIGMMGDTSPLEEFITREAEQLAERCLDAVLPITKFGQRRPIPSTREWVASGPEGEVRRQRLIQAFSIALKLKRWLPLTRKCFEVYAAPPSCRPLGQHVVRADGSSVEPDQIVKLCLVPGVVEYPTDLFLFDGPGPQALCGERNFVKASEEQRTNGRVVSPAIVIVTDKDNSRA